MLLISIQLIFAYALKLSSAALASCHLGESHCVGHWLLPCTPAIPTMRYLRETRLDCMVFVLLAFRII